MEIELYNSKIFDSIKHIDEEGNEYWYARELQKALEYSQWRRFEDVIKKAKESCENSNHKILDNFANAGKIVNTGVATKNIKDYKLSRYACYLIVMNGDSRKEIIALGQTYFAIQTRKQEILEDNLKELSEDEKRLLIREKTKDGNKKLNNTAIKAGVVNLDKFHNAGYKGLYNGETADDIAKRKRLRYREDILDNMGSKELAVNLFRITQTDETIESKKISGEKNSCDIHYKVGKEIRSSIKNLGGTMPEDLPTPKRSLKNIKKIKRK
ncbi:MAG: DNA damage-inducible protein D [Bacilli bacterium]|nr:DNA damage-inducible protein D [Bacilli bacterium]